MNYLLNIYFNKFFSFLKYDNYYLISLFYLILITFIYLAKFDKGKKNKLYFLIYLFVIFTFILWAFILSYLLYFIWQQNSLGKYFLPPYQKINYYLGYVYFHFWRDILFRLLGSLLVFFWLKFLEFIWQREIFYQEEKILVPLLSLFFFFPYNLVFVFLGFFMLLLIIMINFFRVYQRETYFSFKNFWIILAWIIILFEPFYLTNYIFLKFRPF